MRAAYELIQRDGSKETSVHDVLRETGFSTRAFYRHFRSKDELVLEMYRVDCDRVNATSLTSAVASAPTPLAALEAWIDQNLAVVYDARRLRHAVVLSSAEVSSAEGFTAVKNAGLAAQRVPLVALLRDGRKHEACSRTPNPRPTRSRSRRWSARTCVPGSTATPAALTRAEARDAHARAVPARARAA